MDTARLGAFLHAGKAAKKGLCSYAGREDCDVRMLGDGRPFVLEIMNARAAMPPIEHFAGIQQALTEVNSRAQTASRTLVHYKVVGELLELRLTLMYRYLRRLFALCEILIQGRAMFFVFSFLKESGKK